MSQGTPFVLLNGLHDRANLVLGAISVAGATSAECMVIAYIFLRRIDMCESVTLLGENILLSIIPL